MFENYTASFEIDTQRVELRLWDTSGKDPLRIIRVLRTCVTVIPAVATKYHEKSRVFDIRRQA